MKKRNVIRLALLAAMLFGLAGAAWADAPAPGPRTPRPSPQPAAAANNGVVYITVKENASPAQLELPRAMTRRDSRRSDAGESAGRIRLAVIVGSGTVTLLLAGLMGFARMGQFRGGRAMLVLIGAGIAFVAGTTIVAADLAVTPRPEAAKKAPVASEEPTVVVRATEDAKGVMLVISSNTLRSAIAAAEAAEGHSKK